MIEDKAIELGRMIGQSPEYQAVKRANEALSGDRDAVALLQRLEQLRVDAQRMIERGENPTSAEMEQQLDQLLGTIQSKPIYQAAVTSQENFDKIMAAREQLDPGRHQARRRQPDHHARMIRPARGPSGPDRSSSKGRRAWARRPRPDTSRQRSGNRAHQS